MALGVDPANPVGFPTGISFIDVGDYELPMTPLTVAVPEPQSCWLLPLALAWVSRRTRPRNR